MHKYLLLFVFQITSAALHAQDYVVTQRNDTLRGEVIILGYDVYDRIEVRGLKKTNLTIFNVKLINLKNEVYNPVRGSEGVRMMKLIKKGYLSQYKGRSPNTNSYDVPYLVKLDGSATEVPNVSFKKYMISFLGDCESIKNKIENGDLGKKELEVIVDAYNQCIEDQTKVAMGKEDATPAVNNSTTSALAVLQAKIEKDTALPTQKDALDILKDMLGKVNQKQAVPNYLVEGLKNLLKDSPAYQKDLENVVSQLKNP